MRPNLRREDGQAVVEYAVLLFFIAAGVIALVATLGTTVGGLYQSLVNAL